MSGIGYEHNKFHTCYGCPDRSIEPNCHATCRGYIYRQEEIERRSKERRKNFDYYQYKDDVMTKKGKGKEK